MRLKASKLHHLLILTLGLGLPMALPEGALAARPRSENVDVCTVSVVNGVVSRTLVFRDVPPLRPGDAVSLRGIYFSAANVTLPFEGSAVMAADGMVRIGLLVHTSARRSDLTTADFLLSGETDTNFSGDLHFRVDGEIYPGGLVTYEPADCAAIVVP